MANRFRKENLTPPPHTSDEMIIIQTPSGKRHKLHARPVAHLSSYFRMALNSNFKEGQTRTFHLTQHCDDDVVGIFTNWIYLRSLTTWHYEIAETKGMNPTVAAKAWLFGDYILAPKFQNDMMLYISRSNLSISGPEIMQQIGPHTPEGCALEGFLVETFCFLALNVRCHDTKVMFSWLTERLTRQVANALIKVNLELQELRKWESHEPWIFNMLPIHEFYVHT